MVSRECGTPVVNFCLTPSDVLATVDCLSSVSHGFLMVCSLIFLLVYPTRFDLL